MNKFDRGKFKYTSYQIAKYKRRNDVIDYYNSTKIND